MDLGAEVRLHHRPHHTDHAPGQARVELLDVFVVVGIAHEDPLTMGAVGQPMVPIANWSRGRRPTGWAAVISANHPPEFAGSR
ncbi:hypothetical protein I551_2868 [Mycobacterium ulcerans str. Harvey]|uniref:Uncharacterized protein n=1 Tax=Mycobacterium ulcerans str. Harvey TaxID=1299332 RepID=A0ABP3AKH6_MYCUL|nr:hypothetical protein I551_2868 [Mycobacterium ulcerans str. Harvey]